VEGWQRALPESLGCERSASAMSSASRSGKAARISPSPDPVGQQQAMLGLETLFSRPSVFEDG
jgi:hypothetical protein